MPRKRKSDDAESVEETEPPKKLTKKERLEAARAKGQEFGKQDKELLEKKRAKLDSSKDKASSAAQQTQKPRTEADDPVKKTGQAKPPAKRKATPRKKPTQKAVPPAASPPVAQPPPVASHASTSPQIPPQAYHNAAQVPLQNQTPNPNLASFGQTLSPQQQQQLMQQQQLAQWAAAGYPGYGYAPVPGGFGYGLSPAAMQQQQQQQQFQQQFHPGLNQGVPGFNRAQMGLHPSVQAAPSAVPVAEVASSAQKSRRQSSSKSATKRQSKAKTTVDPPAPAPCAVQQDNVGIDDEDEDETPPPPPQLVQQISRQVLANGIADLNNQPIPYREAPPEAFALNAAEDKASAEEKEDDPKNDDQPDLEEDQDVKVTDTKRVKYLSLLSILFALLAVGVCFPVRLPSFKTNRVKSPTEKEGENDPQCFVSSYGEDACPDGGVPCPDGGVCENGELVWCSNKFRKVSSTKDECVFSEQYKNVTAALQNQLELLTLQFQVCDQPSEQHITFGYEMLLELLPDILVEPSPDFIESLKSEGYVMEYADSELYLGLPKDYRLPLPLYCHTANALKWVLRKMGDLVWNVCYYVSSTAFSLLSAYPLGSMLGFLFVCFISYLRKRRAQRAKLQLLTANVRTKAYAIIQEKPNTPHVLLHVRDEIVYDLYPDSAKDQEYLIRNVWPAVVKHFKHDNRVRKAQKIMDGKPRDVWQWVSSTKTSTSTTRFADDAE